MSLPPAQIAADFAAFQQQPPNEVHFAQKMAEQQEKQRAADEKLFSKKAAKVIDLANEIKEEDDSPQRAAVMRKINSYQNEFPARLEHMKIPKGAAFQKLTLDELKLLLANIQHEMGKKGGKALIYAGYMQLMVQGEQNGPLVGLNLQHLEAAASQNVYPRKLDDGTFVKGNIGELLDEVAIKYEDWLSQSVEVRLTVATVEMVLAVHRMNTNGSKEMIQKATETAASEDLKGKANKL